MRLPLLICLLLSLGAKAQNAAAQRADSLYQLGNYRAAINAYAELGTARASLQIARAYKTSGLNAKAVEQYKDLVQKHPEQKIARFELGKLYFQLGRFPAAAAVFQHLIQEEQGTQTNPEYAYYLGRVYQQQDNYQPAIKTYARALQADSSHLRSLYQISRIYLGLKENDSVLKYTAEGLKYAPDDRGLISLRAQAFFNEPRYEDAIPLFEELLEQGVEKEFVLKKLAYSYFSTRNLVAADTTYRKLLDFPNSKANALYSLGHIFWAQEQRDSAKIYIQRSIEEQDVFLGDEYQALGRLAREQKKAKEALDYYTKAYEEDRSNYLNYYQVCIIAEEYYADPKTKMRYYQNLLDWFPKLPPYFKQFAEDRIRKIKEEMHFAAE
jgi:tetratricopeptide (TPR) repeat protein